MINLEQIIDKLMEHYEFEIINNGKNYQITNFSILMPQNSPSPYLLNNTVYAGIFDDQLDSVLNGNGLFLNTSISQANGNNTYIISEDYDLAEFVSILDDLFKNFNELDDFQNKLISVLKGHNDLQSILEVAYNFLNNPITICDASYAVITSIPDSLPTSSFDTLNEKQYLNLDAIKSLSSETFFDRLTNSNEAFLACPKNRDSRMIFSKIQIGTSSPAFICLRELDRPFNGFEKEHIKILSEILAIALQKQNLVISRPLELQGFLLHDLLNDNFADKSEIASRFEYFGYLFRQYFWVITVQYNAENIYDTSRSLQILNTIFPNDIVTYYHDCLVCLISKDSLSPLSAYELDKFQHFLQYRQLKAAISNVFSNIGQANIYFKQSKQCLVNHSEFSVDEILFYSSDYFVELLFTQVPQPDFLITLIHPDIKFLMDYDRKNNTELLFTLFTYLNNNRNQQLTANALFVHKSTVSYRLSRIVEVSNIDLTDSKTLFLYELSYKTLKFLKEI